MTIKINDNLNPDKISLKELKQIAKLRGYYLKPITKYNKMVTCICGANHRKLIEIMGGRMMYKCNKCGFKGFSGYGAQQARDGWNKAIQNYYNRLSEEDD